MVNKGRIQPDADSFQFYVMALMVNFLEYRENGETEKPVNFPNRKTEGESFHFITTFSFIQNVQLDTSSLGRNFSDKDLKCRSKFFVF